MIYSMISKSIMDNVSEFAQSIHIYKIDIDIEEKKEFTKLLINFINQYYSENWFLFNHENNILLITDSKQNVWGNSQESIIEMFSSLIENQFFSKNQIQDVHFDFNSSIKLIYQGIEDDILKYLLKNKLIDQNDFFLQWLPIMLENNMINIVDTKIIAPPIQEKVNLIIEDMGENNQEEKEKVFILNNENLFPEIKINCKMF